MSLFRTSVLAVVAALLVWALVAWLTEPSDEDQVREQIDAVIDGARDANVGKAIAPLSDRYLDADGMDKNAIRGLLFQTFARRGAISILRGPITVELDGATATATFDAVLAEQAATSLLPVDGDALSFTVSLEHTAGTWRVVDHERRPLEEGWRLAEPPQ